MNVQSHQRQQQRRLRQGRKFPTDHGILFEIKAYSPERV